MKKLIYVILAAAMLLALTACGKQKPMEPEIKEWTRQGTFEDSEGNHLFVNLSETEGYEGWAVSFIPDGETVGWIIQQEGNTLHGNLRGWDENAEPFIVTISEEGEDGLKYIDEYADGTTERGKKLRQAICDKFNFASLEFQSLEGVVKAIGLNPCELCTYCWNGEGDE